jgi:hypothetical protein
MKLHLESKGIDISKMTEAMKDHGRAALKLGLKRIAKGANARAPKGAEPRIGKRGKYAGKVMKLSKSYKAWTFKKGIGGKAASFDPLAHLIELGTKGHKVKAKNKKVLAGADTEIIEGEAYDSMKFYGQEVDIPAQPPRPHLGPAADAEFPSIMQELEDALGAAIDRAT